MTLVQGMNGAQGSHVHVQQSTYEITRDTTCFGHKMQHRANKTRIVEISQIYPSLAIFFLGTKHGTPKSNIRHAMCKQ